MFCTLVTLYFTEEVPLEATPVRELADSSRLLKDAQQHGHGLSNADLRKLQNDQKSEIGMVVGKANSNDHVEFNSNIDKDQIEAFNDGPGAVLVHILTSLRHLPSAMHSVLLVMALTWMIVSLSAGPWDALFGGGNIPAFALASIFSLAACVVAVAKLPRLSSSYRSSGFHEFG